jgi:hypothetical protein
MIAWPVPGTTKTVVLHAAAAAACDQTVVHRTTRVSRRDERTVHFSVIIATLLQYLYTSPQTLISKHRFWKLGRPESFKRYILVSLFR